MGRKLTGRTIKKARLPSIAVTPNFKKAADERAAEKEYTTSEYIRRLIEDDLKAKKESE